MVLIVLFYSLARLCLLCVFSCLVAHSPFVLLYHHSWHLSPSASFVLLWILLQHLGPFLLYKYNEQIVLCTIKV